MDRTNLLSPSFLRTTVSVNFCMASVMNFVAVEDAGSHRKRVTETIAWARKPIRRTPSTASSVHVLIGLIPISDFIDENSFSTTSLDRYLDRASRGSMSRSETRQKNPSLPVIPFSRRRRSASSSVISVSFVWSEMVALIRTLSIW